MHIRRDISLALVIEAPDNDPFVLGESGAVPAVGGDRRGVQGAFPGKPSRGAPRRKTLPLLNGPEETQNEN